MESNKGIYICFPGEYIVYIASDTTKFGGRTNSYILCRVEGIKKGKVQVITIPTNRILYISPDENLLDAGEYGSEECDISTELAEAYALYEGSYAPDSDHHSTTASSGFSSSPSPISRKSSLTNVRGEDNIECLRRRGLIHFYRNQYEEALSILQEAIQQYHGINSGTTNSSLCIGPDISDLGSSSSRDNSGSSMKTMSFLVKLLRYAAYCAEHCQKWESGLSFWSQRYSMLHSLMGAGCYGNMNKKSDIDGDLVLSLCGIGRCRAALLRVASHTPLILRSSSSSSSSSSSNLPRGSAPFYTQSPIPAVQTGTYTSTTTATGADEWFVTACQLDTYSSVPYFTMARVLLEQIHCPLLSATFSSSSSPSSSEATGEATRLLDQVLSHMEYALCNCRLSDSPDHWTSSSANMYVTVSKQIHAILASLLNSTSTRSSSSGGGDVGGSSGGSGVGGGSGSGAVVGAGAANSVAMDVDDGDDDDNNNDNHNNDKSESASSRIDHTEGIVHKAIRLSLKSLLRAISIVHARGALSQLPPPPVVPVNANAAATSSNTSKGDEGNEQEQVLLLMEWWQLRILASEAFFEIGKVSELLYWSRRDDSNRNRTTTRTSDYIGGNHNISSSSSKSSSRSGGRAKNLPLTGGALDEVSSDVDANAGGNAGGIQSGGIQSGGNADVLAALGGYSMAVQLMTAGTAIAAVAVVIPPAAAAAAAGSITASFPPSSQSAAAELGINISAHLVEYNSAYQRMLGLF